jgi:dihydroxyacetone kinase-like predicted kinase
MISGKILRDAIISGANNINNQRSRVDELNVFPVPDGDTGTNMGMTVGAAVRELQAMDDSCTVGEAAKLVPKRIEIPGHIEHRASTSR